MMKKYVKLIFMLPLVLGLGKVYGQAPTREQAEEMARRMRTMTPQQMMKFRDSLMNAVMHKEAKILPNGNQLLQTHHYDTTYTTVHFSYTKKVTQNFGGTAGSETYLCYGKSLKAPMIYEANGHTIVRCNLNSPGANTGAIDQMAKSLNQNLKYMTPQQASAATNNSRQMSFSSLAINDNSLTGAASDDGHYSGHGGSTTISTRPPVIFMAFSFTYDPVQGFSTIGVGAQINRHTVSSSGSTPTTTAETGASDDTEGIGMNAGTDPKYAKMVGVGTLQSNPDDAYIKVTKTPRGFKIQYTKIQHLQDSNADISETLSADIGEPEQQYEAVIQAIPDSKYEQWLPKGPKVDGSDDTKGDDSARFYVVVRDKNNPNKMYPGNFTVKYQLKDVTHYKGFNSNYPVYNGKTEPDFKISDSIKYFSPGTFDPNSVTDSTATSQPNKGNIAIVRLMCMDYGAWGKLTAAVTLDDGTSLKASPYYDKGETFITIPYDRDENKIADAWEKKEEILHKGYALDWDEDVRPDNKHNGDNIPLIDEYRGFLVEDDNYKPVFKRFSPGVKELITIGLADMSTYGASYKEAIKTGAMGFNKVTKVKVYHLTQSKYGQHDPGEAANIPYGRWVNYNSPTTTLTHGVVIYAYNSPNPDPTGKFTMATTYPNFDINRPGYFGGQVPDDTRGVFLWTYNIVKYCPYEPTEFLPARPQGNDIRNRRMNSNIKKANAEFHTNIDTLHVSQLVAQFYYVNIARAISFTVAHELCHATNIHHHNVIAYESGRDSLAFFKGVSTCPVRYWTNNYYSVDNSTWIQMYITGLWNPATMTTPWGPADVMALCTEGDDCFHQMKLKKE